MIVLTKSELCINREIIVTVIVTGNVHHMPIFMQNANGLINFYFMLNECFAV